MSKLKYDVLLPKTKVQLEGLLLQLFKAKPKHIVIRIIADYIDSEDLKNTLNKYQDKIENYKKNKSLIILSDNYEAIPDFISVAPTEEEAVDIIEFEDIERDLLMNE